MDTLERRYRRLLFTYPGAYRQRRGDEIVGTFLDLAAPGQTWPRLADAADLIGAGLRQRANPDLLAGGALAGPVALALAAGLSGFLWLSVEPLVGGPVDPAAYAAWLLALAGWVALPGRYARWPVASAVTVTALVAFVNPRPPLWVVLALLAFGAIALTAPPPRGATVRLAVVSGALVTAALGKWLLGGKPPAGYYQPLLSLAGLVVAGAVVLVAAGGVLALIEGRRARPWLWAALLIALPGGWLGPRGAAAGPGFGRLAEVLLATCVVLAAMAALTGVRSSVLHTAGGVALGCAAGFAGYLWIGSGAGLAYAAWVLAILVPAPVRRIGVVVAIGATLAFGSGRPLVALVLLGFVVLLCPPVRVAPPAGVAVATLAVAGLVTLYDNGWHMTPAEPFGHTVGLVLMLTLVPFTVAAFAGATVLRQRPVTGILLLLLGIGWVGALTVPHLAAWGPILVLVPSAGAATGAVAYLRARRCRT